jgi:hypothetical protein
LHKNNQNIGCQEFVAENWTKSAKIVIITLICNLQFVTLAPGAGSGLFRLRVRHEHLCWSFRKALQAIHLPNALSYYQLFQASDTSLKAAGHQKVVESFSSLDSLNVSLM